MMALGKEVNTINGINVGISGEGVWDASCGIQRMDKTGTSGWQDGYMGNYERLYFTATDLHLVGAAGAPLVIKLVHLVKVIIRQEQ